MGRKRNRFIIVIVGLVLFLMSSVLFFLNIREGLENDTSPIPRHIFQTWHTKDLPPKMAENVENLKKKNPEFTHHLFDENECAEFIRNHFEPNVLSAYERLIPKAFKADLWRYCVLYIHGGIYLDIKFDTVGDFKLIELTNKEYFARDLESSGGGVLNGIIICKPNNEKCWKCIQQIVQNVENGYYGNDSLSPTGPNLMKQFFTADEIQNMELSLEGKDTCPTQKCVYLNDRAILFYYKEYRDEQTKGGEPPYYEFWDQRNIYK